MKATNRIAAGDPEMFVVPGEIADRARNLLALGLLYSLDRIYCGGANCEGCKPRIKRAVEAAKAMGLGPGSQLYVAEEGDRFVIVVSAPKERIAVPSLRALLDRLESDGYTVRYGE